MTDLALSPDNRSKAVFIDGPNAHHMKGPLGIDLFDFHGLYNVLTGIGKLRSLFRSPLYSMHPALYQDSTLAKACRGAGIEVLVVESRDGTDDEAIKKHIDHLDPKRVGEIVIMTTDKDFIPTLLTKASQGITVYWAATECPDPVTRQNLLSADVQKFCASGHFKFVELKRFKQKIGVVKHGLPHNSCHESQSDTTKITLTLTTTHRADHLRFLSEAQRLVGQFGGAKILNAS